ncbi:PAS domain S-box protein [Actinoplanes sp. G11-F43]|uniref:PAS domain S-box protein n=1 Tax=Actinoplanes sp. G11-F43 TaxID=3424130 RepID=UPI003D35088F
MGVGFLEPLVDRPVLAEAFARSPVPKAVTSLTPGEAGTLAEVNEAFCALLGYRRDQLIGRSWRGLVPDEDVPAVNTIIASLAGGKVREISMERVLLRSDGTPIWVRAQTVLVSDGAGRAYAVGEIIDCSGRKALAQSEARFRTMIDSSPIAMAVLGPDGDWLRSNPAVSALFGYTGPELSSAPLPALIHPAERDRLIVALNELVAAERDDYRERRRFLHKDGQELTCLLNLTALRGGPGIAVQILAQIVDVTAATNRETERLRGTIAVQREIAAVAHDRTAMLGLIVDRVLPVLPAGEWARVRPAGEPVTPDDGGTLSLLSAPMRAPGGVAAGVLMVGSSRAGAFTESDEQQLTLLADTLGAALRHADDIAARDESLERSNSALRSLERERAAVMTALHQLARSERQFAEVFDHSPIAKIVVGVHGNDRGRILMANPAFCRLLDYTPSETVALRLWDITTRPPEELEQALEVLESGTQTRGVRESVLVRRDGTHLSAMSATSVITDDDGVTGAVIQLLDMTAEREARAAADRQLQRLRHTLAVQREVLAVAADRDATVRVVTERAVDLFAAAEGAAVELVDGADLVDVATAGGLRTGGGGRTPLAGSASGRALLADTVVQWQNDAGSMLIAPLHLGTVGIGVLKVASSRPGAFDDADEQQLALLADSLSSAMRHADDTAQRTRALAELEVSENRFRLTFDNSPLGIALSSLRPGETGRYLQVNPAMTAITGYSAAELTGMTAADLEISAESGPERRYRHRDGHPIGVSVRSAVVHGPDGTPWYVVDQVEDVTARRAADAELRRHARTLELIPAAVIVRELDGTIRWWNHGATGLYGWPLAAVQGKITHQLLATAFPDGMTGDDHAAVMLRDGRWEGQIDHLTADGRTVTVLSRQVLHQPDDGGPQILEINTDVTAARAAELALAESEQRFRGQFTNSAVGQVIQGLDGHLLAVNPAYAAMLGRTIEEITHLDNADLLHPDDQIEHTGLMAGLFAGEADAYTHQSRLRHADGRWIDAEATVSLVRDNADRPKHLIAVVTDVSGRRAAERARDDAAVALADRASELEAANQLKLDIIGMLGHEIGNPLTAIRGHAEVLVDDWPRLTDERRARAIDAIYRQAGRLDDIVQEVLAMVTIESGTIRADRQALSVRTEIGRALSLLDASVPVLGEDRRVVAHPGHLQQILANLLTNAAKYGGGATAIRIVAAGRRIRIAVEDHGPGVPEEFRDWLFDRLTRADRDARSVNGTGLGLYIVRGLAHANHGDIRYEPNPAGGSRFVLDLQAATDR